MIRAVQSAGFAAAHIRRLSRDNELDILSSKVNESFSLRQRRPLSVSLTCDLESCWGRNIINRNRPTGTDFTEFTFSPPLSIISSKSKPPPLLNSYVPTRPVL